MILHTIIKHLKYIFNKRFVEKKTLFLLGYQNKKKSVFLQSIEEKLCHPRNIFGFKYILCKTQKCVYVNFREIFEKSGFTTNNNSFHNCLVA